MTIRDVIGIDLSLRQSAAVLIPGDWNMSDWRVLETMQVGYEKKEGDDHVFRAHRLNDIANAICAFVKRTGCREVAVEDAAYGMTSNSVLLAELAGAVKARLVDKLNIAAVPLNQSTIRKYFLGKLPPRDRAEATHAALKSIGAPWEESDKGDAFLVANCHRTCFGMPGLTLASVDEPKALSSRSRKRKLEARRPT